ncbi:unnamed protein product [Clonostachys chloroleuca]|uniref:JmjC domain-containing protein n=1 Tax=Clonostachys chloroleuca TaxID=1926264 RepID=A0AA35MJS0_9HYPO|nr:unnamed protein product [Clonostachys chloroleuca]
MGRYLLRGAICLRYYHYTAPKRLQAVASTTNLKALTDVDTFRENAFNSGNPFHFRNVSKDGDKSDLPAASKWFESISDKISPVPLHTLSPTLAQYLDWPFPFELVSKPSEQNPSLVAFRDWLLQTQDVTSQMLAEMLQPAISELPDRSFFQLYAPLRLLKKALEFNQTTIENDGAPVLLYIAQSSLTDLPPALQEDLPTPHLVQHAGKGDVYNSSIWLGTEPTYTPIHRDPNPNLFYQLCSHKIMRLLPPTIGDRVYFEVQAKIRQHGNSRIRTTEMMEGKEREALHEAIWANEKISDHLLEVDLAPGDALFIPKGWWHSVKSKNSMGHLNGSVNWWFR